MKRILSAVTTIALVLSLCAVPTFASTTPSVEITADKTTVVKSGVDEKIMLTVVLNNPDPVANDITGMNFTLTTSSEKLVLADESTAILTNDFGTDTARTYTEDSFTAAKLSGLFAEPITATRSDLVKVGVTLASDIPVGEYTISTTAMDVTSTSGDAVYSTNPTLTIKVVEELSTINVTDIAAPVKSGTPATTATAPTNTTVSAVTWSPDHAAFGADTAYTATVTVTPDIGYTFASGATFQINGKTATVTNGENGAKVLSYQFSKTDSKTLDSITIDTQPTDKSYVHGDALDTAGMVVKATYDNSTTATISDYTISYTGGESYLEKDETTATVTYGGKTATVSGLTVDAKELTITGLTATDRAYDGTTAVALTGGALSGKVGEDTVSATMPITGTISNANVADGKAVTFTAISLTGEDAGNYTLTQPAVTVDITEKALTDSDFTMGANPAYTGSSVNAPVTTALGGSDYTVGGTASLTDVASTDATITFTGAGNYSGTISKTWNLTPVDVTITGATAASKTYDGTNTATVGGTLAVAGKIATDDVTATAGTATFADQYAGSGKAVTFNGYTLSGAKAGNYNLTAQPAATTADITAATDPVVVTATASVTKGGHTLDLSSKVSGAMGDVTYSVPASDGTVTSAGVYTSPNSTGTATVTVAVADKDVNGDGTKEYSGTTKSITVTITDKLTQTISFAESAVTKIYSAEDFSNVATVATGDGAVSYASGTPSVATVDEDGKVTILDVGSTIITATAAETTDYAEATATYTLTVNEGTITITAANKSAYNGAAEPSYTYTVTGLRSGETLTTEPTSVTAVGVDMATNGTYVLEVSEDAVAPAGDNYNAIVYVDGTLTVSTKPSGSLVTYCDIKIAVKGEGTVSPDGGADDIERVKKGADQVFTFTPAAGHKIADVLVDGKSVGAVSSYKFEKVAKNQTLEVVFQEIDTTGWNNPFVDVHVGDWFYNGVKYTYINELMDGTSANTFSPTANTTRSMVWTVLARMEKADLEGGELWYSKAQEWAMAEDVSDGTNPDDLITREQFVTMLWRNEESPVLADYEGLADFTDIDQLAEYAQLAMAWAHAEGIIQGKPDDILSPKGTMTRAEMAVILQRYLTAK